MEIVGFPHKADRRGAGVQNRRQNIIVLGREFPFSWIREEVIVIEEKLFKKKIHQLERDLNRKTYSNQLIQSLSSILKKLYLLLYSSKEKK